MALASQPAQALRVALASQRNGYQAQLAYGVALGVAGVAMEE